MDGIPGHTVAALVNGGNAGLVVEAIWKKKPPGIGTDGSITRTVTDEAGNEHPVKFSRPSLLPVYYRIELTAYAGYDAEAVELVLRSLLFDLTNSALEIGEELIVPQLYGKIYQAAGEYAPTFAITSLSVSGSFGTKTDKVTPAWNQKLTLANSDTDVTIVMSS